MKILPNMVVSPMYVSSTLLPAKDWHMAEKVLPLFSALFCWSFFMKYSIWCCRLVVILVILKSQQLKIQPSSEWIRTEGHHKMTLVKSGVVQYNDLIWKNNTKNKIKKKEKRKKRKKSFFFIKMTYLLYIESIKRPAKNFLA